MDTKTQPGSSSRPQLPPRPGSSSVQSSYTNAPPSYESVSQFKGPWSADDPRSSSTQSLVPSESNEQDQRRKLLLIYIHGFMGNETSFRSFPAHVHNLLTVLLVETHVVHTKVYPRYRSKKNISFARDDFSKWLEPHEDSMTDVILLGHSMGGLLSAEVVLKRPNSPANRPLQHRILGTINFDVPFLGMHPGVVKSGLASIFKPGEEAEDKWSGGQDIQGTESATSPERKWTTNIGRTDTLWKPEEQDPNFNPSFQNDVVLPVRKGWQNTWHFIKKHSDHLGKATQQLVTSHLEFGGAMANYPELKQRYGKVRALEEEDENVRRSVLKGVESAPPRVRFVNYYTASTGRVKKPKSPNTALPSDTNESRASLSPGEANRGRSQDDGDARAEGSRSRSPRISLEEHADEGVVKKEIDIPSSGEEEWNDAAETLAIDKPPEHTEDAPDTVLSPTSSLTTTNSLPPIPDLPQPPLPLDVSYIQDSDTRKLVEKEHAQAMKSYEKAMKDREKVIKDRAKLEEKKERKTQKEAEKAARNAEKAKKKAEADAQKVERLQQPETELTYDQKEKIRLEKERERTAAEGRRLRGEKSPDPCSRAQPSASSRALSDPNPSQSRRPPQPTPSPSQSPSRSRSPNPEKPKKEGNFCSLPPKDSQGQRDPLWVRIFMENVDEVGAHCGLFFVDERYERLVGEVADRIESWVREDGDARLFKEETARE